MKEREEARKLARAMKARLGRGWKMDVWNNFGWHAACRNQNVSVYSHPLPSGKVRYSCLVADHLDRPAGGSNIWHWREDTPFYCPAKAVKSEVRKAQMAIDSVNQAVAVAARIRDAL